ncbi:hypothetical protein [Micromonospora sp. NPDC048898]
MTFYALLDDGTKSTLRDVSYLDDGEMSVAGAVVRPTVVFEVSFRR